MRLVKVLVPDEQRDVVLSVLDDENIDHVLIEEANGGTVIEFPLPEQAVDYVQDRLEEAGVDDQYLVTLGVESVRTDGLSELEQRFIEGEEGEESVPREEIRATALGLNPDPIAYYAMTVISAIVAVAGLLLDSAALVVGSMVIAPQVGSALTTSVGAALDDWGMVGRGVRAQLLSLAVAVVGAAVFGWLLQSFGFVSGYVDLDTISQIGHRLSPGFLTLTVGVAAGVAGALGIATALPVALVGVMVAVALIPAAATVGIGIAWGRPSVAFAALILLVVNVIAINVAGFATLRALGYRPEAEDGPAGRRRRALAVGACLLVVLGGVGFAVGAQATFQNDVTVAVNDVLTEDAYQELELVQVRTEFVSVPRATDPTVTVVINRPADESYPDIAERLGRQIETTTDRSVKVRVEFVDEQRYPEESGE